MQHRDLSIAAHVAAGHSDRLGQVVGTFPSEHLRDVSVLGTRYDDLADVLAAVFAPVPHEERVGTVIRVAASVHLDVRRIGREFTLVFLTQIERIA